MGDGITDLSVKLWNIGRVERVMIAVLMVSSDKDHSHN
jgi:hypothetical protein